MKVKVVDAAVFEACVFGGHCFLKNFPEIMTTGVEVRLNNHYGQDVWHVMVDGKKVHSTSFFTESEMQYLQVVVDQAVVID
ncbi:MAG: hypothetical protein RSD49_17500 [Hafnia sp.]